MKTKIPEPRIPGWIFDKSDCDAVAVSVSLGNSDRDHSAAITLLGRRVKVCRIGVGGTIEAMGKMLAALDGKVDALGIGGADLGCLVDTKWYPFRSITGLLKKIHHTPVVDGSGLKIVLERKVSGAIDELISCEALPHQGTAFLTTGCNRWGMLEALRETGYTMLYGDLMFGLGLPLVMHRPVTVKRTAALLMPLVGYLPFSWLYPTGEKQGRHVTKWKTCFDRAAIIAGDTHYITQCMPERLTGKVVVVNTTTEQDIALFKQAGVAAVVTTTPRYAGRSFGANVMEAALIAATGNRAAIDYRHCSKYLADLAALIGKVGFKPAIIRL
jgi:hypothetical protein